MDDTRRRAFYEIVREIAADRQVVYVGLQAYDGGDKASVIEFTEHKFEAAAATV